jgi:hypothetical protein
LLLVLLKKDMCTDEVGLWNGCAYTHSVWIVTWTGNENWGMKGVHLSGFFHSDRNTFGFEDKPIVRAFALGSGS